MSRLSKPGSACRLDKPSELGFGHGNVVVTGIKNPVVNDRDVLRPGRERRTVEQAVSVATRERVEFCAEKQSSAAAWVKSFYVSVLVEQTRCRQVGMGVDVPAWAVRG